MNLTSLTLAELCALTLQQLQPLLVEGTSRMAIIVPAGQVAEDLTDFLLTVVLPEDWDVSEVTDADGNALPFEERRSSGSVVVRCDLAAAEDNLFWMVYD